MSDWSFNLRTANNDYDDSDSDEEPGQPAPASDDTRLLQEIDISLREEAVVYKPNPFSIARINAIARTNNKTFSNTTAPRSKQQLKKPAGRIVDCFKAQKSTIAAQKKNVVSDGSSHSEPPSVAALPTVAEPVPLQALSVPPSTPSAATTIAVASPTHLLTRAPAPPNSIPTEPTHISILRATAAAENNLDASPMDSVAEESINIQPSLVLAPNSPIEAGTMALHPSGFTPDAPAPPAIPRQTHIPSIQRASAYHPSSNLSLSSPMRVERQRHSHVSALSSPPRSTSTGLDRFLKRPPKPQPFSNNLQPKPHPFQHSQVSSAFLPSRVVPAPVAAAPVIVTAPSLSHNTLPPSPRTKPTAHSNPVAKLPSLFAHKPRTVQSYAVVAPSLPASPPAKVFHPPPEPHKPSRAVKQQPLSDADDFPMSPPYTPDSPSPAPRQKRITIPSKPKAAPRPNKPQRNEDAYDFGGAPDADEAWSTFGGSRTKKPMIQTTKTFRLPMLAPSKGKRAQSGRTGMSANASSRVITFLPPPLNSVSGKVEVVVEDVLHRHALPQKHRANSPAMDMSATPPKRRKLDASPETNTSFTLPSSSPLPKFSPAAERSPTTPTVPKSPKGHESIDIPLIARRYRYIKARMQDVRRWLLY